MAYYGPDGVHSVSEYTPTTQTTTTQTQTKKSTPTTQTTQQSGPTTQQTTTQTTSTSNNKSKSPSVFSRFISAVKNLFTKKDNSSQQTTQTTTPTTKTETKTEPKKNISEQADYYFDYTTGEVYPKEKYDYDPSTDTVTPKVTTNYPKGEDDTTLNTADLEKIKGEEAAKNAEKDLILNNYIKSLEDQSRVSELIKSYKQQLENGTITQGELNGLLKKLESTKTDSSGKYTTDGLKWLAITKLLEDNNKIDDSQEDEQNVDEAQQINTETTNVTNDGNFAVDVWDNVIDKEETTNTKPPLGPTSYTNPRANPENMQKELETQKKHLEEVQEKQKGQKAEPNREPSSEPSPEPQPQIEPTPEPQPEPTPEPEPEPIPEPQTEPEPEEKEDELTWEWNGFKPDPEHNYSENAERTIQSKPVQSQNWDNMYLIGSGNYNNQNGTTNYSNRYGVDYSSLMPNIGN